ncbi:MAG TPA: hypothetical protein PKW75_08455 [candidate division Zixibacteria bacterium]|nr:hypothetical protein [candidate division Zixibacteria bacterium]MDD4916748.1 hypothetical protein [candidate division Zixibacteria bacterium]MDM7973811.1 hypothetical protein [candidate division Zixibacteria bacterium]HOD65356.1 hypothetical protein [candidate division Zixibacteria bacterium]HOZ08303.1 hypothetical protein [candidate division Zixibacteria bacterium]
MKRLVLVVLCVFALALIATAQDEEKGYRIGVRFEAGAYQVLVPGGTWSNGPVSYTINIPKGLPFTSLEWFNNDATDAVRVMGTANPTPWSPPNCVMQPGQPGCQQFIYPQYPGLYSFNVGSPKGDRLDATVNITVVANASVPSLSTYGLIILLVLLGASAVIVIRKRRQPAI